MPITNMTFSQAAAGCIVLAALMMPGYGFAQNVTVTPVPELRGSQEAQDIDEGYAAPDPALLEALKFNAATLEPSARKSSSASAKDANAIDWSRTDNPDGSAAVKVKKPLPTTWDIKVGADLGLPAAPATSYQPDKMLPNGSQQQSGAAWANVAVPDIASIEARVDPSQEQGKLGTTFKRSVPLGKQFSVTVQNQVAVTETFANPAAAASSIPSAGPAPATPGATRVWSNDRELKFNILSTGTTLGMGRTTSTADDIARNRLSAEQKLYGPLNVTTAVTDVGTPTASKSITAGFKLNW
ncbi:MAG: hypothetical protein WCI56_08645 [Hyphomicrobiales bacterium]